jgi:hypothetical protein
VLVIWKQVKQRLTFPDSPDRAKWWALARELKASCFEPSASPAARKAVEEAQAKALPGAHLLAALDAMLGLYAATEALSQPAAGGLGGFGGFGGFGGGSGGGGGAGGVGGGADGGAGACLSKLHGLGLLPTVAEHVPAAAAQMQRFLAEGWFGPEHVKHLVLCAMRAHLAAHQGLQGARGQLNLSAVVANAKQAEALRGFANALAEFSSGDTLVQLSQMAVQMNV